MKLLLIVLIFFCFPAFCQPCRVTSVFRAEFKETKNLVWFKDHDGNWEANFSTEEGKFSHYFDSTGQLIKSIQYFEWQEVANQFVFTKIVENGSINEIMSIHLITDSSKDTLYLIRFLKNGYYLNIEVEEGGKIISKEREEIGLELGED